MIEDAGRRHAATLLDLGRPEQALEHLARALAADPGDARAHCLVALAHLRLDRHAEAERAAREAIRAAPDLSWAHRLRALALLELDRDGEARVAALEACRLEPLDAMAHVVLAGALQACGDEAGAVRAAEHAIELDPESADARHQLGIVLLRQQRPGAAVPVLEEAAALEPEHAGVLNDLAVARLRASYGDDATARFEQVAALDPRLETARHNILHTGRAGRSRAFRRWSIAFALLGLLVAFADLFGAAVLLAMAAGLEAMRAADVRKLSPATRELLRADIRARRRNPARWDWRWPTRLRPWWWLVLVRLPPPVLLGVNLVLLLASIAGRIAIWIVAFGIALPFSARRAYRWWRLRHPAASSWRPPA